jgi:hypothetical protein
MVLRVNDEGMFMGETQGNDEAEDCMARNVESAGQALTSCALLRIASFHLRRTLLQFSQWLSFRLKWHSKWQMDFKPKLHALAVRSLILEVVCYLIGSWGVPTISPTEERLLKTPNDLISVTQANNSLKKPQHICLSTRYCLAQAST